MTKVSGKVSWFGGPDDEGVAPDEGLAFIYDVEDQPILFLAEQPPGTTGLARRLNPDMNYVACRWDYDITPRDMLLTEVALVRNLQTGKTLVAYPADWGPHVDTDRVADISPGLMTRLGISTDDEVEVIFPAPEFEIMLDKAVIDISHWDEVESFAEAKRAGVVGIISKATESNNYKDPTYNERKQAALNAGLLWGAYHFLRPGDMKAQAKYFVDCTGVDENMLYAADHEDEGVSVNDLKEWLWEVEQLTGTKPIIYSGHVLKEQIDDPDPVLAKYRLWLAQYTSGQPDWPKGTWDKWWLWQFTENGDCPGISGDSDGFLDVNKYQGSAKQLRKEWTGREQPAPGPDPEPPDMEEVTITIVVDAPENVRVNVRVEEADA